MKLTNRVELGSYETAPQNLFWGREKPKFSNAKKKNQMEDKLYDIIQSK